MLCKFLTLHQLLMFGNFVFAVKINENDAVLKRNSNVSADKKKLPIETRIRL